MSDHDASGNTGPKAIRPVVSKLDEKDLPGSSDDLYKAVLDEDAA